MVKPTFRTKSITTKVTDEEYERLEAQAGGRALSEWVREVLLRTLEPDPVTEHVQTMLAEYLALRSIVVNVLYQIADGEAITREGMQQLINHADGMKTARAEEQLRKRATANQPREPIAGNGNGHAA